MQVSITADGGTLYPKDVGSVLFFLPRNALN